METKEIILLINKRLQELETSIDDAIADGRLPSKVKFLESTYDQNIIVILNAIEIYKLQQEELVYNYDENTTALQSLIC